MSEWVEMKVGIGQKIYYNKITGDSQSEKPEGFGEKVKNRRYGNHLDLNPLASDKNEQDLTNLLASRGLNLPKAVHAASNDSQGDIDGNDNNERK